MESIFCQDNHISDTVLLDNLIHFATTAASVRCPGYSIAFGEIKEFSLCFLPKVGEKIETAAEIISRRGKSVVVETRVSVDGESAASCKVKFYKEVKNEDTGKTL